MSVAFYRPEMKIDKESKNKNYVQNFACNTLHILTHITISTWFYFALQETSTSPSPISSPMNMI
jgi:hypothetical protein